MIKEHIWTFLKGIAMGMADVVPGVSGGTIAFITGIYPKLIQTIDDIGLRSLLKESKEKGIIRACKDANLDFLFALLLGIGFSVLSLAKLIVWLLSEYPILVWSFFFGLVLVSVFFVLKQIQKWTVLSVVLLIVFSVISYWVTVVSTAEGSENFIYLFISGFIAIIAMILPGISGSFILLLMGMYTIVLGLIDNLSNAIVNLDWSLISSILLKIAVLGLGAIVGLKTFSKLLNWLFHNYKNILLAILSGFMIGSLNKIWPWKQILETRIIHGKERIISEKSIFPSSYGEDPNILGAIVCCSLAILFVGTLEYFSLKSKQKTL